MDGVFSLFIAFVTTPYLIGYVDELIKIPKEKRNIFIWFIIIVSWFPWYIFTVGKYFGKAMKKAKDV